MVGLVVMTWHPVIPNVKARVNAIFSPIITFSFVSLDSTVDVDINVVPYGNVATGSVGRASGP